ncbi:MAG: mercury resistance system transport protein MerF [Alphaproteobacteria bacterium]|nr:mercury resistance system transport protein MerF [Alphaproteobacteria bacterium]
MPSPNDRLLRTGVIGTLLTAICCFTPVLVLILGAIGLGAAVGWLDYVLFPLLAVFVVITVMAVLRRQREGDG